MTTVLVTGFEPFGGETENASGRAVAELVRRKSDDVAVAITILPVSFRGVREALNRAIATHHPDALICVGEAGGRSEVTPEKWASNRADARIPDNTGDQPSNVLLDGGPLRLAARIDPDELVAAIRAAGIRAHVSEDAGRFVCNTTFRAALTLFDGPACFIHVPALRSSEAGAETGAGPQARGGENHQSAAAHGCARYPRTFADLAAALEAAVGVAARRATAE